MVYLNAKSPCKLKSFQTSTILFYSKFVNITSSGTFEGHLRSTVSHQPHQDFPRGNLESPVTNKGGVLPYPTYHMGHFYKHRDRLVFIFLGYSSGEGVQTFAIWMCTSIVVRQLLGRHKSVPLLWCCTERVLADDFSHPYPSSLMEHSHLPHRASSGPVSNGRTTTSLRRDRLDATL